MNFIEHKNAHDKLLGITHLKADREHLKRLAPGSSLISAQVFDAEKSASDILWELLNHVSADEVVAFRRNYNFAGTEEERAIAAMKAVSGSIAPADETPAEEEPAAEEPADETPAEEEPTAEEPADETPAEEEPAAEKKSSSRKKSTPK